jgi:TRAP-type C4-dicarboxylate transport system permease small subunit
VSGRFDEKIRTLIDRTAVWCGGGFLAIAVLMTVHAIGRYIFNTPVMGQSEIVSSVQLCAVAIGGWYVQSRHGHIVIGMIVDKLPQKRQDLIDLCTYSVCLVFFVICAWQTFVAAGTYYESGRWMMTTHIPYWPLYAVLGVGWVLIAFVTVLNLIVYASSLRKKEEA